MGESAGCAMCARALRATRPHALAEALGLRPRAARATSSDSLFCYFPVCQQEDPDGLRSAKMLLNVRKSAKKLLKCLVASELSCTFAAVNELTTLIPENIMTTDYGITWSHLDHYGNLFIKADEVDFEALLRVLEVGREEISYGSDGHSYTDSALDTIRIADHVIHYVQNVVRKLKEYNAFVGK